MTEMSRFEKRLINRRGPRAYRRLLNRMERTGQFPLAPTDQILELGAGNGTFSMLIHERYHPATIHVTDYDTEQVAVARQNLSRHFGGIPPSMVIEQGDATHLAYPERSFDLVLAHQILHHLGRVPDIFRGLDEIARVLRPGGRLLYVEMFHKREIREHLAERGFTVVLRERAWRIFHTADVVVARLPALGPVAKEPSPSGPVSPVPPVRN